MVYGAIDLHLRTSHIRIVDEGGEVVLDHQVPTTAERLVAVFRPHGPMRIVVEASTESEWVAQALEQAGHTVVVVDPNFAPTYGDRRRVVKTDRRDVAALADANRKGWYRAAYRVSAAQRAVRQRLRARQQVVRMRSGTISVVRALLRQAGYRVGTGAPGGVGKRVAALALPAPLQAIVDPLLRLLETLTTEIGVYDAAVRRLAAADPVVQRLRSAPGVGPVVALAFRAFVDDVTRFGNAAKVSAALGLVPWEASSADRRVRGHSSKAGPRDLRALLVQAAWSCWRSRGSGALRAWVEQLAARRGKRIAVVALARRLSRVLFALWRDATVFRSRVVVG